MIANSPISSTVDDSGKTPEAPQGSAPFDASNPAGWPAEVLPVFEHFITCEHTTLTSKGVPITFPLIQYIGQNRRTIDVTTGLTYPAKAERARRNPKTAMLFSDPTGSGLKNPPVVLVHGMTTVRDSDIQDNTDRYVRASLAKTPAAFKGMPGFVMHQMAFYFARIWLLMTPVHIMWWQAGHLDEQPQHWYAPSDVVVPKSDVAPEGKQPPAWKEAPTDWYENGREAVNLLGLPVLTLLDENGFPVMIRAAKVSLESNGFRLDVPTGLPVPIEGKACLTFHHHESVFTGQQNMVFVGNVTTGKYSGTLFTVERQIGDWSLAGSKTDVALNMLRQRVLLAPRLKAEAGRRGQGVPKINLPR